MNNSLTLEERIPLAEDYLENFLRKQGRDIRQEIMEIRFRLNELETLQGKLTKTIQNGEWYSLALPEGVKETLCEYDSDSLKEDMLQVFDGTDYG